MTLNFRNGNNNNKNNNNNNNNNNRYSTNASYQNSQMLNIRRGDSMKSHFKIASTKCESSFEKDKLFFQDPALVYDLTLKVL